MGVTYFKRFRMEIDLTLPLFAPRQLGPHYRLVPWRDGLVEAHASVKFRSFCYEIDANVFPCLGDRDGCLRLMREISRREAFLGTATWLLEYLGHEHCESMTPREPRRAGESPALATEVLATAGSGASLAFSSSAGSVAAPTIEGVGCKAAPRAVREYCGTVQGIRDARDFGAIQNLGVTPSHRGLGLGTHLLYAALDGFRRQGLDRALLEVTAQNIGALRLYERLGFRKVKTVYKAAEVAGA